MTRYGLPVTLLPIADRELRVSSRNKATHRLRIWFAIGAVVIAAAIGLIFSAAGSIVGIQVGLWIFNALKWLALIYACAAGIFLTADCLSEEKREGTLGLLFLTDLRGHDVVLGKLLATSLRSFYALLAIFPVMAFSFILGGVAADDFQHTLVSLCNTLFFSLALGMLISVISRDANKAMTGTGLAMIVFLVLLPAVPGIDVLSPVFAFRHAADYRASEFWYGILLVNLEAWGFLAVASWLAPRTWQDKAFRLGFGAGWRLNLFSRSDVQAARRSMLDIAPVCWIISRDRWAASIARIALLLMFVVFTVSLASLSKGVGPVIPAAATTSSSTTLTTTNCSTTTTSYSYNVNWAGGMAKNKFFMLASWCAGVLPLALEFWLAAQVARFYVDAKKSGFLELLFVTPMSRSDVIRGHWLALRHLFLAPVAAQLFLSLTVGIITAWAATSFSTAGAVGPSARDMEIVQLLTVGLGAVNWFLGLFAIAWYSIWMGMASKKLNIAMLKTFGYTKIIPWFCITVVTSLFVVSSIKAMGGAIWVWPVTYQGLFILVNIGLISFARRQAKASLPKWPDLAVT